MTDTAAYAHTESRAMGHPVSFGLMRALGLSSYGDLLAGTARIAPSNCRTEPQVAGERRVSPGYAAMKPEHKTRSHAMRPSLTS